MSTISQSARAPHANMSVRRISVLFVFIVLNASAVVQVPKLKLNDGREIPAIALGTWLGNNTKPSSNEVELAVQWALETGYRHIDTAWIYHTEDQVGRGLRAVPTIPREELFVTTKLWNDRHARDNVVPALRASLQQLQLDYVDLYLIHWPCGQFANGTFDVTDYLESWRGLEDAKRLGLARSIGVSNFNQAQIQRILDHGLEKPAVLQVELNLNLQQPELLAYCKAKDIVVTGYTPFGSLFYSKAKPDAPPPRIDDPALVAIANKFNKTVPQITLRYLFELGVVPLPKSLTKSRIEQNVDIFDFQLSDEDRLVLKNFDKNYRTIPQLKWFNHPHYPFERN